MASMALEGGGGASVSRNYTPPLSLTVGMSFMGCQACFNFAWLQASSRWASACYSSGRSNCVSGLISQFVEMKIISDNIAVLMALESFLWFYHSHRFISGAPVSVQTAKKGGKKKGFKVENKHTVLLKSGLWASPSDLHQPRHSRLYFPFLLCVEITLRCRVSALRS